MPRHQSQWYFIRFSCSKAGLLRSFWQERADEPDLALQMRVLTRIKSEKITRGPFQSGSALVHTARTQGHLPGSPSQEASGRDRSAPSGVGQIRFGVGFLQGTQWFIAGWSSPVARQAHNLKVTGSNPVPATRNSRQVNDLTAFRLNCSFSRARKAASATLSGRPYGQRADPPEKSAPRVHGSYACSGAGERRERRPWRGGPALSASAP